MKTKITTKTNQKITYFIYARKSSESEDRQIQSIDDQVNRLKELAKTLNLDVKEILTEAKSAKKPDNRPVFDGMMNRIKKGEANGILCWQINRLSRNPVDSGAVSWMLQQGILQCIQTIDRKYLPDDNVLLFSVESGMANQFIIDLRKNSRRGMEGKAERGWLPSHVPMGYLNNQIDHTIVKDSERFDLFRKMWELMLTGNYTPPQIRKIANDDWGLKTKRYRKKGGDGISNTAIYKFFTNIFYTGMFEWSGKTYQGNHPPMITLEEYDRVQVILGKRGKPRAKTHAFAYTGVIYCKDCGAMYTATEKTKIVKSTGGLKTYIYYHCTKKKRGVKCLKSKPVRVEDLENQIEEKIGEHTILPIFRQWALDILAKNNDKEISDRTKVYETQHTSLVETQKELDGLTRMRYKDLIDDEAFIKEANILKDKIAKLKEALRQTESRAEKWLELTERTFNFTAYARIAFLKGTLEQKREILAALGSNFFIQDENLLIETNEWLVPIEKDYSALEEKYRRLELTKNLTFEAKNEALVAIRNEWGATRQDVGTMFKRKNDATIYIPALKKMDRVTPIP